MSRPRTIDNDEILETTRKLLLEQGLRVSTRQIARAVGISEGVLFQRFASKEGLIRAALTMPPIDAPAVVAEARSGESARVDLEEIGIAILGVFRRLLPRYVPLIGQPQFGIDRLVSDRSSPFMQLLLALEDHLAQENESGRIDTNSPHRVAFLLVSALHNAALFETLCGSMPEVSETAVRQVVATLWAGLEPQS